MLTNAKPKFSKFYFPGMISLVVLPLLCVVYLAISSHFFQKYGVITLKADAEPYFTQLERSGIDKRVDIKTGRNYAPIKLTGDKARDANEQKQLEALIGQLILKKDTASGISIQFGQHATYANMVDVIDKCEQSRYDNIEYSFCNGELYIRYVNIGVDPLIGDLLPLIKEYKAPYPSVRNIFNLLSSFWPSLLAFIAMISFAFSKKRYYILSKPTVSANN